MLSWKGLQNLFWPWVADALAMPFNPVQHTIFKRWWKRKIYVTLKKFFKIKPAGTRFTLGSFTTVIAWSLFSINKAAVAVVKGRLFHFASVFPSQKLEICLPTRGELQNWFYSSLTCKGKFLGGKSKMCSNKHISCTRPNTRMHTPVSSSRANNGKPEHEVRRPQLFSHFTFSHLEKARRWFTNLLCNVLFGAMAESAILTWS